MNEHQLRSAVYALDLKPNTKLTLLGVMCFVNWDTWSGPCSAKDVAKKMSMNERAVKRALKELTDLNILKRSAQRRAANNHHRAVTEVNVPMIMGGDNKTLPPSDIVTLPPSDIVTPPSDNKTLPPSDIMTLPPSDIVTPNTTEDYNRGSINLESTEDTQPTSPDQDAETVEAVEAVEVGDSDLPSELIGLSAEYIQLLREHAADHQCSLLEAYEYAQRINRNAEAKLAWRREREKSAMFNRPTTAYRPKPLY